MAQPKEQEIDIFSIGDSVVYPSHGVGVITAEEIKEIGGIKMPLYVISFADNKMVLWVPKSRVGKVGLRHLSSTQEFKKALEILQGKPKLSKGMWTKRAQEYDAKINSGKPLLIAEVLRDLHKNVDDPERSYSELKIYKDALERLADEYSIAASITKEESLDLILKTMNACKE